MVVNGSWKDKDTGLSAAKCSTALGMRAAIADCTPPGVLEIDPAAFIMAPPDAPRVHLECAEGNDPIRSK